MFFEILDQLLLVFFELIDDSLKLFDVLLAEAELLGQDRKPVDLLQFVDDRLEEFELLVELLLAFEDVDGLLGVVADRAQIVGGEFVSGRLFLVDQEKQAV